MAREVPLTQGQVAVVDDDDYDRVAQYKWHVKRSAKGDFYAQRRDAYGDVLPLGNFILRLPPGIIVDHIDHVTLNYRKSNLRQVTRSQNGLNQAKRSGTSSRYVGVTYDRISRKWKADISVQYQRKQRLFDTEEEAAAQRRTWEDEAKSKGEML